MEIINVSSDDESVNENCPIINQQEDFILDEHAAMFCFVYKYYYNKNPILQILFSNQTTKKKPKKSKKLIGQTNFSPKDVGLRKKEKMKAGTMDIKVGEKS